LLIKNKSSLVVIALLVMASCSQFVKQAWLASGFNPEVYAGWATAVLASQLLFNFGGLGFHNFASRHAAIYESRGKRLLTNRLVAKQLLIYTYILPLSIPVIYFLIAKPAPELFTIMLFYSVVNVFLNSATNPIYVRSSLEFAKIQSIRGVVGAAVAVVTCYFTGSLLLTLISESLLILVLGIMTLKSQNFKWRKKYFKLDWNYKVLLPFFLPVLLATVSLSLSRIIAIDLLNDEFLGTYYFIFIVASFGFIFQYGLSVFFGPIITSRLSTSSTGYLNTFILRCWIILVIFSLLVGLAGSVFLPFLVSFLYPGYSAGLILIIPMLFLAMAKICDIWSIYFLLGGFEKFLYIPHLCSIILAILIYIFVVDVDNFKFIDMRFFIFGEALATFFIPLLLFLIMNIRWSR